MEFDRHLWLVAESLRLADATTLGNGLESRVPFLDPRIVAASHATPSHWHVTYQRTKALLKDTYAHILPPHLQTLSKAGFFPPLAKWFRRESASLFTGSLEHPRIRELFDVAALQRIYDEHLTKKKYHFHTLSSITQLRFWFEEVYDA
jgi:asparagine synthase (glutamine-hydrolysing)